MSPGRLSYELGQDFPAEANHDRQLVSLCSRQQILSGWLVMSPGRLSYELGQDFSAEADGVLLRAWDSMQESAAVWQQDGEVFPIPHQVLHGRPHILTLEPCTERLEGEAVLACHALESLQAQV